jgi:hypothetical protein
MNKLKARLQLILKAENVVIAESEDPILWQKVLTAITQKKENLPNPENIKDENNILDVGNDIDKLAKKIGVDKKEVIGACDPKKEPPFIQLDMHYWEMLKKNTPERGSKSISPFVLAFTLLNLWKSMSGINKPDKKMANLVVDTINLTDPNADRAVKNCEWLQKKPDKTVVLNPAQQSKAIAIAKAYILKNEPEFK